MTSSEDLDDLIDILSTTPPFLIPSIEALEKRIQQRESLHSWLYTPHELKKTQDEIEITSDMEDTIGKIDLVKEQE